MSAPPLPATKERILDAAVDLVGLYGAKATVSAIAEHAGVSHMTVHRLWKTKDELIQSAILREAQNLFAVIDDEVAALSSVEDRIVAGFTGIYWFCRTSPLFSRMMHDGPDSIVSMSTAGGARTIDAAIVFLAGHIERAAPAGSQGKRQPRDIAEILVRLSHSLMLTPSIDHPIETREDADEAARRLILPVVRAAIAVD